MQWQGKCFQWKVSTYKITSLYLWQVILSYGWSMTAEQSALSQTSSWIINYQTTVSCIQVNLAWTPIDTGLGSITPYIKSPSTLRNSLTSLECSERSSWIPYSGIDLSATVAVPATLILLLFLVVFARRLRLHQCKCRPIRCSLGFPVVHSVSVVDRPRENWVHTRRASAQ